MNNSHLWRLSCGITALYTHSSFRTLPQWTDGQMDRRTIGGRREIENVSSSMTSWKWILSGVLKFVSCLVSHTFLSVHGDNDIKGNYGSRLCSLWLFMFFKQHGAPLWPDLSLLWLMSSERSLHMTYLSELTKMTSKLTPFDLRRE